MSKRIVFMVMPVFVFGVLISCAKKQVVKPETEADNFVSQAEEPSIRGKEYQKVEQIQTIYFDYDSSDLKTESRNILKANSAYLKENTGLEVLVEGHCDERGSSEYNMALGQRRAASVRSYYIQLGVSADRLSTISYGEEKPLNTASNEYAWSKNRRAETLVRNK